MKDINATGPSVIPFTNGTSSPSGGNLPILQGSFSRGIDASFACQQIPAVITVVWRYVCQILHLILEYETPTWIFRCTNLPDPCLFPGDFNVMVNVSEGLSNGAIGGIVAGCIVGAAALTFVCFYVYSRKRQDKRTEAPASLSEPKLGGKPINLFLDLVNVHL